MSKLPKDYLLKKDINYNLKAKYLGKGFTGECWLTEKGQVYKELYNPELLDKYMLKQFTYIDNEAFYFPRTLIYKDNLIDSDIDSYLLDYVEGDLFVKIPDTEKMSDLIKASDEYERNIYKVSGYGPMFVDLTTVYTPDKKFKCYDTDLFEYNPSEDPYILYKEGLRQWGLDFMLLLNTPYPFKNEMLNEYYLRLIRHGKMKPSVVAQHILDEANKVSDHEIETLGEFKDSIKLIRKL